MPLVREGKVQIPRASAVGAAQKSEGAKKPAMVNEAGGVGGPGEMLRADRCKELTQNHS